MSLKTPPPSGPERDLASSAPAIPLSPFAKSLNTSAVIFQALYLRSPSSACALSVSSSLLILKIDPLTPFNTMILCSFSPCVNRLQALSLRRISAKIAQRPRTRTRASTHHRWCLDSIHSLIVTCPSSRSRARSSLPALTKPSGNPTMTL